MVIIERKVSNILLWQSEMGKFSCLFSSFKPWSVVCKWRKWSNEDTKLNKKFFAGDELRAKRRPEMDTNGFYGDTFSRLVKLKIDI